MKAKQVLCSFNVVCKISVSGYCKCSCGDHCKCTRVTLLSNASAWLSSPHSSFCLHFLDFFSLRGCLTAQALCFLVLYVACQYQRSAAAQFLSSEISNSSHQTDCRRKVWVSAQVMCIYRNRLWHWKTVLGIGLYNKLEIAKKQK